MMQDRQEEIRRRAYAMWELEGRPEGRHEEHWRRAEEESSRGNAASQGEIEARGEVPGGEIFEAMPDEGSRA